MNLMFRRGKSRARNEGESDVVFVIVSTALFLIMPALFGREIYDDHPFLIIACGVVCVAMLLRLAWRD